MSSSSTLLILPILEGRDPCSRLKLTSNTVTFLSIPIVGGKHPVRLSFNRIISFNVFPILPILAGMQPPRSLLANTSTETGEFPRFSGIPKRNLLSFKKMASRSLSKSFVGTPPSNSLNRRSRYLSRGRERTTSGNFPTKRLLLISSSNKSFKRRKVVGMTPQKRLELRWKTARSVSRPSSVGR